MSVEADFAVICDRLTARPGIDSGKILRSFGLRVSGKFFAFARDDELVVKLPAERVRGLVETAEGRPFRSGGRVMKEWVTLRPTDIDSMGQYVTEAHDFVASLAPPATSI